MLSIFKTEPPPSSTSALAVKDIGSNSKRMNEKNKQLRLKMTRCLGKFSLMREDGPKSYASNQVNLNRAKRSRKNPAYSDPK